MGILIYNIFFSKYNSKKLELYYIKSDYKNIILLSLSLFLPPSLFLSLNCMRQR